MELKLLLINILLGFFVIYGYFKYLGGALKKGITSDQLWANIKGNYRNIYYISMLLSTLSYLYLLYYFVFITKKNNNIVYIGTLIFFVGANLWAPTLFHHLISNQEKIFIYISLCLTTVGIILLFIHLMNKGNLISKICISIFLFHILILDNLIWSIKFQKI